MKYDSVVEIVTELNETIYDRLGEEFEEDFWWLRFEVCLDGYSCGVKFAGNWLVDSENDDLTTDLRKFLTEKANERIELLQKMKNIGT